MPPEGEMSSVVVRSRTFTNGTVVTEFADGTRCQTTAQGVKMTVYPDGRREQLDSKNKIEMLPDGTKIQTNLLDGSTFILRPDGSRSQVKADGSKLEVNADGDATETHPDGVIIRLFADGSKEQINPHTNQVLRSSPLTSTAGTSEGNGKLGGEIRSPAQCLYVLEDGSQVQINSQGLWSMVYKDRSSDSTTQKSCDGDLYLHVTKQKSILFRKNDRVQVVKDLRTGATQETIMDRGLLAQVEAKCQAAERDFVMVPQRVVHQSVAKVEAMLVGVTKRCETQLSMTQARSQKLKEENDKLLQQVTALTTSLKMERNRRIQLSTELDERTEELGRVVAAPSVSSSGVESVSVSTQWSLSDAREQFFKRQSLNRDSLKIEEDEANYLVHDPQMMRLVLGELKARVIQVEDEKQRVEDRLIDLRISIENEAKKKSSVPVFGRIFPRISDTFKVPKSKKKKHAAAAASLSPGEEPSPRGLMRKESLLVALNNVKQRQESASDELSMKKRESIMLNKEVTDLKKELLVVEGARDEARDRCTALERELEDMRTQHKQFRESVKISQNDLEVPEVEEKDTQDDEPSSSDGERVTDLQVLPSLEEELQIDFSLSPVSPMI